MKRFEVIVILTLLAVSSNANVHDRDSLLHQLNVAQKEKYAEIYNLLAYSYVKDFNMDSARLYTNKAFELALKEKKFDQQAEALYNYGAIYEYSSNSEQGIFYKEKAAEIFKGIGDIRSYAVCINDIAGIWRDLGRLDKALELYNKACQLNTKYNFPRSLIVNLVNIGLVYCDGLEYNEALKYYSKALKKAQSINYKKVYGSLYNNMGSLYSGWGKHDSAIFYYEKSLKYSLEKGFKYEIGNIYNNLGNEYRLWKKYDKALEFNYLALKVDQESKYDYSIMSDYNNIGLVYFDQGNFKLAKEFFQKEMKFAEDLKSPYYLALSLNNLGKIFRQLGNSSKALTLMEQEINIIEKHHLAELSMGAYQLNGLLLIDVNKFDNGITSLRKSLAIATKASQRNDIMNSCKLLADAFKSKGMSDSALKYFELYNTVKDSVFNSEQHRQLAEFQTKYGLDKAEVQLAISNKEKQQILNKQKTWIAIILLGFAGMLLVIIKLYRYQAQHKKLIALLTQQNKDIEENLSKLKSPAPAVWSLSDEVSVEVFQKITAFLKQTRLFLQDELTLPFLAQKSDIQAHHISKAINSVTGSGFSDYINSLRIDEAKNRLKDHNFKMFTIEAIGRSVGFKSRTSFIAAFKKLEDITPSEFKKKIERQYETNLA